MGVLLGVNMSADFSGSRGQRDTRTLLSNSKVQDGSTTRGVNGSQRVVLLENPEEPIVIKMRGRGIFQNGIFAYT
uniref:Uncharacterized protein n=1 Tax=viral metagenome TaxID=1070528 RepID=A0A6C0CV01_9ZZZZ